MPVIRPATAADAPAIENLILSRSAWLEERGLPSWRQSAADLAAQAENSDGSMYVLEDGRGRIAGCTTVQEHTPPWGWSDAERREPAYYLYSTVTDPAFREHRPGTLIALWATDKAAGDGKAWTRRGCMFPGLVAYYETQGFVLRHTVQRTRNRVYLMERRAEPVPGLGGMLAAPWDSP
ncbi:GNAT family N-acetyltransferase [Streptomyces pactum]|uniref:GNAT family N-acetyltransferase n=1 Tax=Streptomyces pactum TaxID=68249 RepID=A0ABS0NIU9_9ACTN|nr:GNAT family N-acetyltransferase [Streptomyces pactum]MBH5335073.1 GNAT family N-acetyltransferase [Streptomyces pactum]